MSIKVVCVSCVALSVLIAQGSSFSQDFFDAVQASRAEKALDSPKWIGAFSCRITADTLLDMYTSKLHGCAYRVRGIFGFEKGKVIPAKFVDGELRLDYSSEERAWLGFNKVMILAEYEKSLFLVPIELVHGFCLDLKKGRDLERFLSNSNSVEKNRSFEKLILPERFRFLTTLPELSFAVSEILPKSEENQLRVKLKTNKSEVYLGMQFSSDRGLRFDITEVGETTSVATATSDEVTWREQIKIGAKLTTGR